MPVQTQLQQRRGTAASWTSTNPTLAAGEIGFESDTGKIKIGTGSTAWNALAYTASSTAVTYLFNATGGQTTFSGADANGLTLAYTVGSEQVYLNGVLQVRGSDYTATNGTSIVLASGALVSDVLNVIAFSALALSDTYTQAQADAKFVQQSNNFFAGKNKIINGDFSVNQRNFTSTTTSAEYNVDRWRTIYSGGTSTTTVPAFTLGAAPVAGYEGKNYYSVAITGQSATTDFVRIQEVVESVRTFAGQTTTYSFWAKASAGTPKVAVFGVQFFGQGGSPSATVSADFGTVTLSTTWTRYSVVCAIPSIAGKTLGTLGDDGISIRLMLSGGSSVNNSQSIGVQNYTFDTWGHQWEAGSIATPFQTSTGTIQGELAACQRYYYRNSSIDTNTVFGSGWGWTSTQATLILNTKVTMRTKPFALDYSSISLQALPAGTTYPITSWTLDTGLLGADTIATIPVVASGLTASLNYRLIGASGSAYVGLSAEL